MSGWRKNMVTTFHPCQKKSEALYKMPPYRQNQRCVVLRAPTATGVSDDPYDTLDALQLNHASSVQSIRRHRKLLTQFANGGPDAVQLGRLIVSANGFQ